MMAFVGPRAPTLFIQTQRIKTNHLVTWLSKPFLLLRAAFAQKPPPANSIASLGPLPLSKLLSLYI